MQKDYTNCVSGPKYESHTEAATRNAIKLIQPINNRIQTTL